MTYGTKNITFHVIHVKVSSICIGFVEVICKVIKLKLNLDLDGEGG